MHSLKMLGIFLLVPVTVYLTASFFVMFTMSKVESQGLKNFGKAVVALLWICALLFAVTGIYLGMKGPQMPGGCCGGMMKCGKDSGSCKMMDKGMMMKGQSKGCMPQQKPMMMK